MRRRSSKAGRGLESVRPATGSHGGRTLAASARRHLIEARHATNDRHGGARTNPADHEQQTHHRQEHREKGAAVLQQPWRRGGRHEQNVSWWVLSFITRRPQCQPRSGERCVFTCLSSLLIRRLPASAIRSTLKGIPCPAKNPHAIDPSIRPRLPGMPATESRRGNGPAAAGHRGRRRTRHGNQPDYRHGRAAHAGPGDRRPGLPGGTASIDRATRRDFATLRHWPRSSET